MTEKWVQDQLAILTPPVGWELDSGAALTRLHARADQRRPPRAWLRWAAVAGLAVAAFLLHPAGRALSDVIWQLLTVPRVAVVRVNPWPRGVRSPKVGLIGTPVPPIPARDRDEVRQRVNYDPRLPRAGVLSSNPQLYTTFSLSAGTTVNTADLQLALQQAGVTGLQVPPAWDGAQLALHTSAVVIAQWPDFVLVQSLPLTLTAPAGFDFSAYSALILRVLGVSPSDAQRLAQQSGTVPPWLAPIAHDVMQGAALEQVSLNFGPATLLQEPGRVSILWIVPDRVYLLSGKVTRDLAIAAANAVE